MMIFLILNLFIFCENLKNISSSNISYEETSIVKDYNYDNNRNLANIEVAINLAYFSGTSKLEASGNHISLTIGNNYFKYVLDELKEIIDILSLKYLDEEFVLLEGSIK